MGGHPTSELQTLRNSPSYGFNPYLLKDRGYFYVLRFLLPFTSNPHSLTLTISYS